MKLNTVCPYFGTQQCIECDLGLERALEECDYECAQCEAQQRCPCSRWSWQRRQEEAEILRCAQNDSVGGAE